LEGCNGARPRISGDIPEHIQPAVAKTPNEHGAVESAGSGPSAAQRFNRGGPTDLHGLSAASAPIGVLT
jgi:hypothetical protein